MGVVILAGVASLVFHGLNYGVEFTGGRTFVVRFDQNVSAESVREAIERLYKDNALARFAANFPAERKRFSWSAMCDKLLEVYEMSRKA